MNRFAFASLMAATLLSAAPASAVTNENGEVLITQAAVNAGNITPGDTPGFPVTINVGGSYRLASNLIVTSAVNGIEVRANEVSLDMGGFTLAGSGIGRNGITSFNRSLTVQNGTIRGFTLDGVRTIAATLRVERMRVLSNGRSGVIERYPNLPQSPLANMTVYLSTISGNAADGITCTTGCRIDDNAITGNGGNGAIFYSEGGLLLGNLFSGNSTFGVLAGVFQFGNIVEHQFSAGNNAIIGNGAPVRGILLPLQPNACAPQAC